MINTVLDAHAYGPMAVQQVAQTDRKSGLGIDMNKTIHALQTICGQHDDLSLLSCDTAWNGGLRRAVFVTVGSTAESPRSRIVVEITADPTMPPRPIGSEYWSNLWLVVRQTGAHGATERFSSVVKGFAPPEKVALAAKQLVRLARLLQHALALPDADCARLVPLDGGSVMRSEGLE